MEDNQVNPLLNEQGRKILKGFIEEAVMIKREIRTRNESYRDIAKEAKDKLGIKPKIFSKLVKAEIVGDLEHEKREFDEVEGLYEVIHPQV